VFIRHHITSAIVAVGIPIILSACATTKNVEQRWPTWETAKTQRIYGGNMVAVNVSGINKLCYRYDHGAEQVNTTDANINPNDFLKVVPKPSPDSSKETTTTDSAENPFTRSNLGEYNFLSQGEITAAVNTADNLLAQYTASTELAVAKQARERAAAGVALFKSTACKDASQGVTARSLQDSWDAGAGTAIAGFVRMVEKGPPSKLSIADFQSQAAEIITADTRARNRAQQEAAVRAEVAKFVTKGRTERQKTEVEWQRLISAADSFTHAQQVIRSRLLDTTLTEQVMIGLRTDSLRFIVKAEPFDTPFPTRVDTLRLPVRRYLREFLSTGIMFSSLDTHDYQSVNRLIRVNVVDSAGNPTEGANGEAVMKDTMVSVFADQKGSGSVTFAPALIANLAITPLEFVDIGLAAGVAARSVGGDLGPEYLLGLTLVFASRFTVNPMWHWGRVEELSPNIAAFQQDRGVPDTIKRDSAVRIRTRDKLAVVFAIRL
jgi:hypothetical protein